jgi:hypothetical protein
MQKRKANNQADRKNDELRRQAEKKAADRKYEVLARAIKNKGIAR